MQVLQLSDHNKNAISKYKQQSLQFVTLTATFCPQSRYSRPETTTCHPQEYELHHFLSSRFRRRILSTVAVAAAEVNNAASLDEQTNQLSASQILKNPGLRNTEVSPIIVHSFISFYLFSNK